MTNELKLEYTLFCEDVRFEASQQLSLMGVMHQIVVPQVPVSLFKFAVVNHWRGTGKFLSEVRILTPDRSQAIAVSQPSSFEVPFDGYADNVTVFVNTAFMQPGPYLVQTLINSNVFAERVLPVLLMHQAGIQAGEAVTESEHVN
jgi:hypothetical protein